MAEILIALAALVAALLGLNSWNAGRNRKLKAEVKKAEKVIETKTEEMKTLKEVRDEIIEAAAAEPKPEQAEAPAPGDSDSRIERLNRLHKH